MSSVVFTTQYFSCWSSVDFENAFHNVIDTIYCVATKVFQNIRWKIVGISAVIVVFVSCISFAIYKIVSKVKSAIKKVDAFEAKLNRSDIECLGVEQRQKSILKTMSELYKESWNKKDNIEVDLKVNVLPVVRNRLYRFFNDDKDPIVRRQALEYLIILLERDPLHDNSANGLVELSKNFITHVKSSNSEELGIILQYRLMKTYAFVIICVVLNWRVGKLTSITDETKNNIRASIKEIQKLSKNNDFSEDLKHFIKLSKSASQYLSSETSSEWINIFKDVSISIASVIRLVIDVVRAANGDFSVVPNMAAKIAKTGKSFLSLYQHINEILDAKNSKEWFEKVITLKMLSRLALYDEKVLKDMCLAINSYRFDEDLYYEVITVFKFIVLNSPFPSIKERALSYILQTISTEQRARNGKNSAIIERRIVMAIKKFACSQDAQVKLTSYLLLNLLHFSEVLSSKEVKELLNDFDEVKGFFQLENINGDAYRDSIRIFFKEFIKVGNSHSLKNQTSLKPYLEGFINSIQDGLKKKKLIECLERFFHS